MDVSSSGLEMAAFGRHFGLVFPGSMSHTHVSQAGVFHDRRHVGKVQVDDTQILDQIGNTLGTLTQHIVGDFKRVGPA